MSVTSKSYESAFLENNNRSNKCSSTFVSSEWIKSLQIERYLIVFNINEFLASAQLQFLIISKFCNLSLKTVNLSLSTFYQTDFITASVISRSDFDLQIEALIEQFKITTADQFMRILKLIQTTNHGNQLATIFQSNWYFTVKYLPNPLKLPNELTDLPVLTQIRTYGQRCPWRCDHCRYRHRAAAAVALAVR